MDGQTLRGIIYYDHFSNRHIKTVGGADQKPFLMCDRQPDRSKRDKGKT